MWQFTFFKQALRHLLWLAFALSLLVFSLGVSWQLSKSANFFYGFWYQSLQIDTTIKNNVIKNTQDKDDFPIDDAQLHYDKFADIVLAIHLQGEGLDRISYQNSSGEIRRLLTHSEVVHLQDVANLLDSVSQLWLSSLLLLLPLLVIYTRKLTFSNVKNKHHANRTLNEEVHSLITMPKGRHKLISICLLCLFIVLVLFLWGFTAVFYYLHTVVFPAEHQWFFYYKDSLMATIMKAPDIFSAIAAQLLAVALLIAISVDTFITRIQRS